jgi:hypothetical protein
MSAVRVLGIGARMSQRVILSIVLQIGCCALWAFCLTSAANAGESSGKFDTILEKFKASTAIPDQFSLKATERVSVAFRRESGDLLYYYLYKLQVHKDFDRIDAQQERLTSTAEDMSRAETVFLRSVAADGQLLEFKNNEANQARELGISAIGDLTERATEKALWMGLQSGRVLEGHLGGNGYGNHLADVMKRGKRREMRVEEGSDGTTVYMLEADTEYGRHTLWIDATSFLPRRIERRKTGEDILYDRAMSARGYSEHLTIVDEIETAAIQGRQIPIAARVQTTEIGLQGGVKETLASFRIDSIDFNPRFSDSGAFTASLKDGTPIIMQKSDTGLQYEWRGGGIVPAVDPGMIDGIEGAIKQVEPFPRQKWGRSSTIVLIVLSLLCFAVLGFLIFRRIRFGSSGGS